MTEHKHLRRTVFAAYCLLMIYLLFLQRGRAPLIGGYVGTMLANLNLTPGAEILRFLRVWNDPLYHRAAVVNIIGNIVMFIPLGFGLRAAAPLLENPARLRGHHRPRGDHAARHPAGTL